MSPPWFTRIVAGAAHRPLCAAVLLAAAFLAVANGLLMLAFAGSATLGIPSPEAVLLAALAGTAFLLLTAAGLGLLTYLLLRQVALRTALRIRSEEALLAAERRAMAGTLGLAALHDSNNVLMVALATGQLLLQSCEQGVHPPVDAVRRLMLALERLAGTNRRVRDAVRKAGTDRPVWLDLAELVEQSALLVGRHEHVRNCRLEVQCLESVITLVHPAQVQDAIVNLVLNAAEACGADGRIRIVLRPQAGSALLEVHDNGPGVPPELAEEIFRPFVTTKAEGTGLGLASVSACAASHHGEAAVGRSELGGACFTLRLPLPAVLPAETRVQPAPVAASKAS